METTGYGELEVASFVVRLEKTCLDFLEAQLANRNQFAFDNKYAAINFLVGFNQIFHSSSSMSIGVPCAFSK